MNVHQIKVDQTEARRRFQEYRAAVRRRHNAEDHEIMRVYRELARGRAVIDAAQAIQQAGVDEQGRPRLAIAKATAHRVYCETRQHLIAFSDQPTRWGGVNFRATRSLFRVPVPPDHRPRVGYQNLRAIVPIVPPALRPDRLHLYHVLWEADWEAAPVDPLLLRRIGGPLFAVVAAWDLTEVERLIITSSRADA